MSQKYTSWSLARIWIDPGGGKPSDDPPEIEGAVVNLPPEQAVLQLYDVGRELEVGQSLPHVEISHDGIVDYRGRASVLTVSPEETFHDVVLGLGDAWLTDTAIIPDGDIAAGFARHFAKWNPRAARIDGTGYRSAVSLLRYTLKAMRDYCIHVERTLIELGRDPPAAARKIAEDALDAVVAGLEPAFAKFESAARRVNAKAAKLEKKQEGDGVEFVELHKAHARRALHPLLLPAVFLWRIYHRPLGLQGDYGMVRHMLDDPFQGQSANANLVNGFAVKRPEVLGHQNRVKYLFEALSEEGARVLAGGSEFHVLDVGCGPAEAELQILRKMPWADKVHLHLLDTCPEALAYVREQVAEIQRERGMTFVPPEYLEFDVRALLKQARGEPCYHTTICAGLYDYVPEKPARKVTQALSDLLLPGGLGIVTNVHPHSPTRGIMSHLLGWELILRNVTEVKALAEGCGKLKAWRDPTRTNVLCTMRKPGG